MFYYICINNCLFISRCLAKDSLKNAENACAKHTIDCSKKCGDTADFTKQQTIFKFIEMIVHN